DAFGECLLPRTPPGAVWYTARITSCRPGPGGESSSMASEFRSRDDTSLTLMMRVKNPDDPEAWDEFVGQYRPMIEGWCRSWGLPPSDIEDVTQDVLLRLLAAIRQFEYDPSRSFRSWLKTVTRNALTDFTRARRRDADRILGQAERLAASVDAMADLERKI